MAKTTHNALSERAMLVNLHIGCWEGRKKDQAITTDVVADNAAEADSGAWWTYMIPKNNLKPMQRAVSAGRAVHLRYSLPWSDLGTRILPAAMFLDYTAALRKVQGDFNAAVTAFLVEYPALARQAQARLGSLFKEDAFPTIEQLASKFRWETRFAPLPDAADFRVDLGDDIADDIRKSIETQTKGAMEDAMRDVWRRLYDTVTSIASRLANPKAIFRNSLIENATDICNLLPKLNIMGDSNLDVMRANVLKLIIGKDPEVLRTNKAAREDAAAKAGNILKQMEAFMGAKK